MRWLLGGGNLLIFTEGAWNITENQVVMKLFPGAVEMAIWGKADTVPVVLEAYRDTWYVNIGRNIDWCSASMEQRWENLTNSGIYCVL